MSQGIATYSSNGIQLLDINTSTLPLMTNLSTNYTGTSSIPFNSFNGIYGVTLGNSPLQVSKTNNGYDWNVSTYGIVSSDGSSYIQPSVDDSTHYTSNNKPYVLANPLTFRVHHHRGAITPISSNVLSFGYKTTASATYGMSFANLSNQFIVDSETKTYYLHPDASGNPIRTGYAGVLPFSNTNAIASVDYTFTSTTPTTITFEKAFVEQPLIFIVSTTEGSYQAPVAACDPSAVYGALTTSDGYYLGGASLHAWIKDGSGRYIGASILASGSTSATINSLSVSCGWGQWGNDSGTTWAFRYFVVSPEEPTYALYGDTTNFGVQVMNSSGVKTFDSRYKVCCNFQVFNVGIPYKYFVCNKTTSTATSFASPLYGVITNQTSSITLNNQVVSGVLINNQTSVTGHNIYNWTISSGFPLGPRTYYGRYLHITETNAGGGLKNYSITISPDYTTSLRDAGTAGLNSTDRFYASWDYHWATTNGTMSVVVCNLNLENI
jgi:hypothetical protein